jgi:hypothetical protein
MYTIMWHGYACQGMRAESSCFCTCVLQCLELHPHPCHKPLPCSASWYDHRPLPVSCLTVSQPAPITCRWYQHNRLPWPLHKIRRRGTTTQTASGKPCRRPQCNHTGATAQHNTAQHGQAAPFDHCALLASSVAVQTAVVLSCCSEAVAVGMKRSWLLVGSVTWERI